METREKCAVSVKKAFFYTALITKTQHMREKFPHSGIFS